MRQIAVVIPSRNADNLRVCVAAVREMEPGARVIIVDDGVDWDRCDRRMAVVPGEKPFVYARNCNRGIVFSGDDDVILLNDDAILKTRNGFSEMASAVARCQEYGLVGAVTNVTGQVAQRPQSVGLREVPHFAFVCAYIPRRTINTVGLLDERYSLDYGVEDRDYCEMVRHAGFKVGVFDWCFVDHGSLQSSFREGPHVPRSFAQNWGLFKEKWGVTDRAL